MNRQTRQDDSVQGQVKQKPKRTKSSRSGLFHWIVAGGSLATLAALVYFGLQLVERDPSKVPVIKAMAGPSRIAPETPGGEIAEHLGLAVNKIQTGTGVDEEAESVALAPEQHSLTDEEVATGLVTSEAVAVVETTSLTVEDSPEITPIETTGPEAVIAPEIGDITEEDAAVALAVAMALATEAAQVNAPLFKPKLRPRDLITKVKTAALVVDKPKADAAFANRISEVEVGTKLVQLGAYDSEEQALTEWKKLMGKHSDFLGQKKMLVQPVVSGGRQLYRLRAVGFDGRDEAKGFCTALNARGVACFALTAR
jgi:hypothetical protein